MEQSTDDNVLPTNFFRAIQKNKIIQGQLANRQRFHYAELVKAMKNYNSEVKYNRDLLYAWKKESYIRQLKKNVHEYQRQTSDENNAYCDYQIRNLEHIKAGRSGLMIPHSEEERRTVINTKYQQFLEKYPLQTPTKSPINRHEIEKDEDENTRDLNQTWQYIHAQSAIWPRRKHTADLPIDYRASTTDEGRRRKFLTKDTNVSKVLFRKDSEAIDSLFDEEFRRLSTKISSNPLELPDSTEPLNTMFNTMNDYDLISMRSIRRPRKTPSDIKYSYESRKHIYQMNKRVFNVQSCHRKY